MGITGQRHTDDKVDPSHAQKFVAALGERSLNQLSQTDQDLLKAKLCSPVAWQKFDHEKEKYDDEVPMNSYDVLKCSQACFHLFEWLRGLLPESERPARYMEIDMKGYRLKEADLRPKGLWPEDPPKGPQPRDF